MAIARYPGFCGPSNAVQSPTADAERLINWYQEPLQSQGAPTDMLLLPTPGQRSFASSSDVGGRAAMAIDNLMYVVMGTGLYSVTSTGVVTNLASVAQDANPATISYNGVTGAQLFITSGGNGYCYTIATGALSLVLTGEATMGGAVDGFFLALNSLTGRVRYSSLNDGNTWDPANFFQRSKSPDPWKAMVVSNPEIWFIGENSLEAWYNQGGFPLPFAPIPGAFSQYGTRAPFSATMAGDTLIFLSHTVEGAGRIVAAKGYVPNAISTYAVETAIARFDREHGTTDCEVLVYQEDGHLFVCFSFPAAQATWVVDLGTGLWHERGSWNSPLGVYDLWHPRIHCHFAGKHFVMERGTTVISEMNVTLGREADGSPIRRVRVGPPLWAAPRQRLKVSYFALAMDTGLGLSAGQGSHPDIRLRTSLDTRTYGALRRVSAGLTGQYNLTVSWKNCGSSLKAWMPEITCSDPVPYRISGAFVDVTGSVRSARAA